MIQIILLDNGVRVANIDYPNNHLVFGIERTNIIEIFDSGKKVVSAPYTEFINELGELFLTPQSVITTLELSYLNLVSQEELDVETADRIAADTVLSNRTTILENNEYKITYYEIISGASGSITLPTGATINAGEFGLSGNCILSKIDGSNKPTFESPKTSGGTIVTASLNVSTGAWVASGTYTDSDVALIYSIKIKAVNYGNLDYSRIIETVADGSAYIKNLTSDAQEQLNNKGSIQNYYSGKRVTIPFAGTSSAINGWNGAIIYIPIPITSSVAFTDISQEVTAGIAAQNIRLALYTSVNGLPDTLIEDSGNLSAVTNGLKVFSFTSPVTVNAIEKQVYAAIQVSNNSIGLRYALNTVCFNYFNGSGQSGGLFNQAQAFGAFPATATPSVYANANSPLVSLLVQ